MKYLNKFKFESMLHSNSLRQMKMVSKAMNGMDVGQRVSDDSFANALNTKRDITNTHIQTYDEFMSEPFDVNQNRKPWGERKKKK
jgi:hypothetical protein